MSGANNERAQEAPTHSMAKRNEITTTLTNTRFTDKKTNCIWAPMRNFKLFAGRYHPEFRMYCTTVEAHRKQNTELYECKNRAVL